MSSARAWASARGQLYRFLATAFLRPPAPEFVAPFLDEEVLTGLAERFGRDAAVPLVEFRETFRGNYDALDQEYQDLFVVPLGRYVTPYEAVYRDARVAGDEVVHGLLMGPSTLAVGALYGEAGLDVADPELPDHAGLELACMGALCDAEARAGERDDAEGVQRARSLQCRLLEDHLVRWVPALCARIRENASGPFYRGIANVTEIFLREEAARSAVAGPSRS